MHNTYVKKGITPDFGKLPKLRDVWEAFVQYKLSEEAQALSTTGQINASKKEYHHRLGPGGYKLKEEKWHKMEEDLVAKGIIPVTYDWPKRCKRWLYAQGGRVEEEQGHIECNDKIRQPAEKLVHAIDLSSQGLFHPDREKDELSLALGNPEHLGRTTGYGTTAWKFGFPMDINSYRSRERRKNEERALYRNLENWLTETQNSILGLVQAVVNEAVARVTQPSNLGPNNDEASPSYRRSN